jgi:hypothetical protein
MTTAALHHAYLPLLRVLHRLNTLLAEMTRAMARNEALRDGSRYL